MTTTPGPSTGAATPRAPDDGFKTLVLLCSRLEETPPGLGLVEVGAWLSARLASVQVETVEDLCSQPRYIRDAVRRVGPDRLVLGVCSRDFLDRGMQTHVRRTHLDPLGVQVVGLDNPGDGALPPSTTNAGARVMLAAAVARARAFPGSLPENVKAVLPFPEQKVTRRAMFTLPPLSYIAVPTINEEMCGAIAGCDLCVGACPHGALERDGDTIRVNQSQCRSCGVCVETCPQRAVELPGWSHQEMEAQLASLLSVDKELETPAVVFTCKKISASIGPGWLPVQVSCASAVPVAAVLSALARGAGAVAFQSCGQWCSTDGGDNVKGRVDYCQQLLRLLGGESDSLRVTTLDHSDEEPAPAPDLPALPGDTPNGPFQVFGRGSAAASVKELAARYGVEDLVLGHAFSPLGRVSIDQQACAACGTCATGCPTGALSYERSDEEVTLTFDHHLCIGCARCARLCPEREAGAIVVTSITNYAVLVRGPQVLFRDREARCEGCGGPVATRRMLDRIGALLGDGYVPSHMERLCTNCRGF